MYNMGTPEYLTQKVGKKTGSTKCWQKCRQLGHSYQLVSVKTSTARSTLENLMAVM